MFDDNDHNNTRNDQKIDPVNYLITIIIDIKIRNYHSNLVNYVKYLMTKITSKFISYVKFLSRRSRKICEVFIEKDNKYEDSNDLCI